MATPLNVTSEHMERAYAQLRKHGWPTLQELHDHYCLYGIIRGRAVQLASGHTIPSAPASVAAPPAPRTAPPSPAPAPQRRRSDAPPSATPAPATPDLFDARMAAAGEYTHPDE